MIIYPSYYRNIWTSFREHQCVKFWRLLSSSFYGKFVIMSCCMTIDPMTSSEKSLCPTSKTINCLYDMTHDLSTPLLTSYPSTFEYWLTDTVCNLGAITTMMSSFFSTCSTFQKTFITIDIEVSPNPISPILYYQVFLWIWLYQISSTSKACNSKGLPLVRFVSD